MSRRLLSIVLMVVISLPTMYRAGFLTYFHFNRAFIAENYCVNRDKPITMCYGNCFLTKHLLLSGEERPATAMSSVMVKAELPMFCEKIIVRLSADLSVEHNYSGYPAITAHAGFRSSPFRPPIG